MSWFSIPSVPRMLNHQQHLTNARAFVPSDWTRFDYYARRVREVVASNQDNDGPPHRSLCLLEPLRSAKGEPLLPNLCSVTLQVGLSGVHSVKFITNIAPTSLRNLSLRLHASSLNSGGNHSLQEFAAQYFSIRRVTFDIDLDAADAATLAGLVTNWHSLSSFNLCSVPGLRVHNSPHDPAKIRRLLTNLSMLPDLEELEFESLLHYNPHEHPGADQPLVFRRLRYLTITSNFAGIVQALLEAISSRFLRELRVRAYDFPAVHGVLRYIRSCGFWNTLERLTVTVPLEPRVEERDAMFVLGSDLQPLTHLHNLRELSLQIGRRGLPSCHFETTDNDWKLLASSWPLLRDLDISDGEGTSLRAWTRPTYRSLVHLARHCPNLASVSMTVLKMKSTSLEVASAFESDTRSLPLHAHDIYLSLRVLDAHPYKIHPPPRGYFEEFTWERAMQVLDPRSY